MKKGELAKKTIIKLIRSVVDEWGAFSVADIGDEGCPIVKTMGKDHHQLAERFDSDGITAVTYIHETEIEDEEENLEISYSP